MTEPRFLRLLVALLVGAAEVGIALVDYLVLGGSLVLLQSLPVVVAALVFGYLGYAASFALALVLWMAGRLIGSGGGISELDVIRFLVLALVGLAVAEAAVDRRKLEDLSRTDALTGLANYRWFREALQMEFPRSRRYGHRISLILADVDRFKEINDLYGHQVGNAVLRELAQLFRQGVREVDVPARFGGDEFAVILPETSREEAVGIAERVQQAVAEARVHIPHDASPRISLSFGVATYPSDAATPDALIARADQALYAAKRGGRNQIKTA